MCALCYIYMKHIWCNGFSEIYAQLEEGVGGQSAMGICVFCYIWNWFGVIVFQRAMLTWRRRWSESAMGICVLCYIWNLFGVMVSRDLCSIGGGMGSICHGYICLLLYMKLIWYNGFPEIYAWLEEGWGQSYMGICAFCYTWNMWCNGFQRSMPVDMPGLV